MKCVECGSDNLKVLLCDNCGWSIECEDCDWEIHAYKLSAGEINDAFQDAMTKVLDCYSLVRKEREDGITWAGLYVIPMPDDIEMPDVA